MIKVMVTRPTVPDIDGSNFEAITVPVTCDSYECNSGILIFRNKMEPNPFLCIKDWYRAEVVESQD